MAKRATIFAAVFAALLSVTLSVQAENYDYYWKGGSGNYFTQTNWQLSDGSAAPVPLSSTTNVITAYIDASGSSVNFDYSHLGDGVKSLTIGGGSGAVSVTRYSGNTLTIAPNKFISVLSNGTLTVQNTMFINADGLMSVNGGSLSTTGIEISGTFSYTSGKNFVNANTINLYDGGTLNLAGSGQFRINGASAVLNIQGGNATVDSISYIGVGENGVINQTGGSAAFNNTLAFGWGSGDGTYNLSGGTLTTTSDVGLWCSKSSGFNTFNMTGGTANFNQAGNSFTIGLYQTFTPAQVANVFNLNSGTINAADTFAIQYGGTLKVAKDGETGGDGVLNAKAITLTNSGNLNMSSGTINVGEGGIASSDGAYTVTLSGGTFGTNGSNWSSGLNAAISSDAVTFSPDEGKSITWSGVLSGTGGVTKAGAGTLELTGVNTYTGKTTVSAGTLKLSGSGKLASSVIDVETGSTLTYYNTVPHNTAPLTFNVNGGTLEFYNTTASTTHTNDNSICSGVSGQDVTINGTGATMLIDGGGTIATYAGTNESTVTFALDSNSVIDVKNGCFINGGYAKQNWTNNKATLHIGATSTVNLWNGAQMKVGGLTGEAGAKIYSSRDDSNGITIGNGTTAGQTFVYNGTIDLYNTKTLTKIGAGTQVLNGDITKAMITSNDGTLVLGVANNNINIGSKSIIKTDGGAIRVDGDVVVNSDYTSFSGNWTGNGSVKVNSGGILRINGTFGFAKGITLNGGLLFNDGEHNGETATVSSPITVASNSNVQCGWSGTLTLSGGLNGSGGLTINNDSGWTIVTGKGNYSGPLTIIGNFHPGASGIGTEAAPAKASDYIGSGEITFKSNSSTQGIFQNNNNHLTFSNDLNFAKNSYLKSGWSKSMTFTGNLKGSGQLEVLSDSGWVIMATKCTDDAFTGNVQLNWDKSDSMGKMRLGSDQPFGANAGQGNIYGQLDMNGYSQIFKGLLSNTGKEGKNTIYKGNIFNNTNNDSTLTLDITGKNITYYGVINGNIALEIIGTGTQTFSNNGSNFTGNVVINGGTVTATAAHSSYTTTALGAFSKNGGRTVTINSGAELVLGTNDVLGGCNISNFNDNSLRYIINGGKLTGTNNNPLYNATFQNGAEVYGNNNRDIYRSFWLMGTNNVTFAGDGSTPESPVNFNGASGVIFVLDGTVLNVEDITLSDESDLVVNVSFGNKSESPITTNSLTKTGAGTVELTAANEYDGGTTISEGVLKFTDNAVVANGPITVGDDGTLEYNLSSSQTKKLTITNASKIFSTGKVVKTGDGTLQIYTAAAGQVDASSFVVSSGRLDMKEYFTGALEVKSGATMSPGNSVGTLTIDGTYNLDSGAALLLEVGKDDLGNIVIDQLFVNGNATFESGSIIDIVLDPSSSLVGGDEFSSVIITANNAASIFDDVKAAIRSYYFTDLTVTRSGNEISLSGRLDPNAVPEPSTWALLVLGVVALFLRKRVRS